MTDIDTLEETEPLALMSDSSSDFIGYIAKDGSGVAADRVRRRFDDRAPEG